jgi:membrane protein implicated in regulation of membrane protease activity
VGAAVVGTLLAGATGLLVWGQAQTTLRGGHFGLGTAHFWLGIALTVIVVVVAGWRLRRVQQDRHTHGHALLAGGTLAVAVVTPAPAGWT